MKKCLNVSSLFFSALVLKAAQTKSVFIYLIFSIFKHVEQTGDHKH